MSAEASLRHKLSKKLKLDTGKSQNSKGRNKSYKGGNFGLRNLKSGVHGREDRRGGREESGHEVYGKGRFELFNSDGKRKRVYADQYGDWEATNNRKVQHTKALAKKGHGKVKDVPVKSKSGETKT